MISLVSIRVVCIIQYLIFSSWILRTTGVALSTPGVTFFRTDAERALWHASGLHIPEDDVSNIWARALVLGKLAEDRDYGYLRHIRPHVTCFALLRRMVGQRYNTGAFRKFFSIMLEKYNIYIYLLRYERVLGPVFASMFPVRPLVSFHTYYQLVIGQY